MWVNTTLRKHTNKRVVNYVRNLYQSELNKVIIYMKENGLELSGEKTCLLLFNNGENPKCTSTGTRWSNHKLQAEDKVSGGVHNYKLNWRLDNENVITKARKKLHCLKNS